jgi:hypothetical protein
VKPYQHSTLILENACPRPQRYLAALEVVLLALAAALEESVCQHINTLRIPPRPSVEASPSFNLLQINIQPVVSSQVYRDVASPPGLRPFLFNSPSNLTMYEHTKYEEEQLGDSLGQILNVCEILKCV